MSPNFDPEGRVKFSVAVRVPKDIADKLTEDHWFWATQAMEAAIRMVFPQSSNKHRIVSWLKDEED